MAKRIHKKANALYEGAAVERRDEGELDDDQALMDDPVDIASLGFSSTRSRPAGFGPDADDSQGLFDRF